MTSPESPGDWVRAGEEGMLSVVIPAHNEEGNLRRTVPDLVAALDGAGIRHEILIVNDSSTDGTGAEAAALGGDFDSVRYIDNAPPNGFGLAVRAGLAEFRGDRVALVMADGSDDPADVVACHRKIDEGYDCVFGSRFTPKSRVVDYPVHKLALNRLANTFIRLLFRISLNDTTNAFKCYRREVIAGVQPILAPHFNLTVELPLKAIIRGFTFAVIPVNWYGRKSGMSKLKIREMGSRYLFIVLYCLIERLFARGDYARHGRPGDDA
jgi:dolichol-phosphate mannosyltransferase